MSSGSQSAPRGQIQIKRILREWIKWAFFCSVDVFFWFHKKKADFPEAPKRILVCNPASLGDVVLSTGVLPVLKKRYPGCEIGFLVSVQSAEVLKEHPLVHCVHTIDHWFWKREEGVRNAFFYYLQDFFRVVKEIRSIRYDLAIDLYPHFFLSAIPILWRAKIPVRVGRYIRGFSNLLTHMAPPVFSSEYMGERNLDLLQILKIDATQESPFPSYFSRHALPRHLAKSYIVVHMGTAHWRKEWNVQKWIEVVRQLMEQGERVVLTGKGNREKADCDQVACATGCENECDRLDWSEFTSVIQHAKLLISVDSCSVHLASAVQMPCVVLFAGISSIPVWKPPYSLCRAVMKPVPCAPCLVREGCPRMSCIQEVQVKEVLEACRSVLANQR